LSYYYLPNEASLALDEQQLPEFSLLRYVMTNESSGSPANSITEAKGGAILHFLIHYHTHQETVLKARLALVEKTGHEQVKLKGPVIFEKGRYALISSILGKDGKMQNLLMASGSAPVLEGSKIALSFEMEPETSKLLLESFKMATPDISIVFDMEFAGLCDAYDAELEVDWSQVQKSQHIKASGKVYFVSAEVETLYDELQKEQAITLNARGEDAAMQGLIDRVYDKLTDLFFKPIEIKQSPPAVKKNITSGLGAVVKGIKKKSPFSFHGAYQLKELRTEGHSKLHFSSRTVAKRHHYITFNMGDLYQVYGQDKRFFKTVALDDPDFQQREVFVGVDGSLMQELGNMINNVTVTMRKEHMNGQQTIREILVTPQLIKDSALNLKMVYGSKEDQDRLAWLSYDYRANWKFSGGGEYTTAWLSESSSMINLYAPFHRIPVQLIGDDATLENQGVRAVIIQVSYPFFGAIRTKRLTWKPGDSIDDMVVDITLPVDDENYQYKITWVKQDGSRQVKEGTDNTGLIFMDEL
jgi:hypothetical protein